MSEGIASSKTVQMGSCQTSRSDFDFAIDLLKLKSLTGFEVHRLTDLFRDNDLVFSR
jgi:type III secretory pathway lipoprotein EscJ